MKDANSILTKEYEEKTRHNEELLRKLKANQKLLSSQVLEVGRILIGSNFLSKYNVEENELKVSQVSCHYVMKRNIKSAFLTKSSQS